jgi:hypothetical protein
VNDIIPESMPYLGLRHDVPDSENKQAGMEGIGTGKF